MADYDYKNGGFVNAKEAKQYREDLNIMSKDLYNVYMVLDTGEDVWWQGFAVDGGEALEQALEYAKEDYNCTSVRSWDICGEEI
jgi:hypothetical protein